MYGRRWLHTQPTHSSSRQSMSWPPSNNNPLYRTHQIESNLTFKPFFPTFKQFLMIFENFNPNSNQNSSPEWKREKNQKLYLSHSSRELPPPLCSNVWKWKVGSPLYSSSSKLPCVNIWSTLELATHVITWFVHEVSILDKKPSPVQTSSRQYE